MCSRSQSLWRSSITAMVVMFLATIFTTTVTPAYAAPGYQRGSDYFTSPARSTVWNLGDTVEIRLCTLSFLIPSSVSFFPVFVHLSAA
ncbi:hypothetical protein BG015_007443 [Linnemannia schmuckeri]|uniref:Uncharacterized protein n=1 Tax=Linnemannia schmuckeri TaxID=64567 RepID=A0A9P5RYV3_9FUNG|nr:hypothetical protein BG015_007443 [Linnemannia schmuckeri]